MSGNERGTHVASETSPAEFLLLLMMLMSMDVVEVEVDRTQLAAASPSPCCRRALGAKVESQQKIRFFF